MTKQRRLSNLSFVLLALVILLCVNWLWQNDNHVDQLEYSQVRQLFLQEKVTGLTIDSGGTLTLELREPVNGSETVRYELYSFQLFYEMCIRDRTPCACWTCWTGGVGSGMAG